MKSLEKILEWILAILIVLGCYKLIELGTYKKEGIECRKK